MRHKAIFGRIILALLLTLTVLSMTSCALIIMDVMAHPERLAGTQKDMNYRGSECRRLMIIGLLEDTSQRVAVENVFSDRLTQQRVQAVVGTLTLPDLLSLKDRALMEQLMRDEHIDHLVTIEVKDVADHGQTGWLKAWLATPLPEGDLTGLALSRGVTKNVHFEIGLWDVKSMKREWTGTTHPLNRHDILRHAHEAADSAAYTLSQDNILRPVNHAGLMNLIGR